MGAVSAAQWAQCHLFQCVLLLTDLGHMSVTNLRRPPLLDSGCHCTANHTIMHRQPNYYALSKQIMRRLLQRDCLVGTAEWVCTDYVEMGTELLVT